MEAKEKFSLDPIVENILWIAEQRLQANKFQDINAAIVSVTNDIDLILCNYMAPSKGEP